MPDNSSETQHRQALETLAKTLREFGVVDRFGLAGLLVGDRVPTKASIATKLRTRKELLPAGLTPEYLAETLATALKEISGNENRSAADVERRLKSIKPGNDQAEQFHDLVMEVLSIGLAGVLVNPKRSERQFEGRKILDIVYRNTAATGVFADMAAKHRIHCPYIVVECKNYSTDPSNAELDQLSGRLNDNVGKFGVLVCRPLENPALLTKHCSDYKSKGEYLIYLDDSDLVDIGRNGSDSADRIIGAKVRDLVFR